MTAVAKARTASAPATPRTSSREDVVLPPDVLVKLQHMLGHLDAARNSCQGMINEAQSMIAENAADELAKLVREWARGLH